MNNANTAAAWMSWIEENLARGCSQQSMIAEMVTRGFTSSDAHRQIVACQSGAIFSSRVKKGSILDAGDRLVRVIQRMTKPNITLLDDVLSDEECDRLIDMSTSSLKRSTTVDNQTGGRSVIRDRTSVGMSWPAGSSPFVDMLDERFSQLLGWPIGHGEGLQVAKYEVGGQYTPHFDYFPPEHKGSQIAMESGGQRVSTLLLYLNTPDEGGETAFPKLNLKVNARKGSGIIFEYTNNKGLVDPLSLHAGLPVLRGEKWIATRWMRQYPIC